MSKVTIEIKCNHIFFIINWYSEDYILEESKKKNACVFPSLK